MPSSVSFTETQIEAFLAERFGSGVGHLTAVGHGEWSKAYTFEHAGSGYVARFSAFEEDFAKDRLAARFATPALPIPPMLDIGTVFDGFYAISPRAVGAHLDEIDRHHLKAGLAPDRVHLPK